MKKTRFIRLLSFALALLMTVGCLAALSGCSGSSGKVLMKAGNQTISTNVFQLMLSRVKGTLSRGGYKVDDASFWDTVIDSDGTVYGTYMVQRALMDAKRYLVAAVIFEEAGLTLPKATLDAIDAEIQEFIEYDANGSKSAFNSLLSAYGANVTALRELYILEAKSAALKTHLYGANASQVAATVKQEYLDANAVCFKQILFRNYYEKYEVDVNGDEIYYLTDSNNARVNNISYDSKNGTPKLDDKGNVIVDANKDTVYYTSDGHIAYDKTKGQRAPLYDKNGDVQVGEYTADEKKAHLEQAEEMVAMLQKGDYTAFESLIKECVAASDDVILTDNEYCFLYTTGDNNNDYLNDIADVLAPLNEGDFHLLSSDYGYAILMKYPMVEDAYSKTEYTEWFNDFNSRVIAELFRKKCDSRLEEITVDNDQFAALPSMKNIGTNFYY